MICMIYILFKDLMFVFLLDISYSSALGQWIMVFYIYSDWGLYLRNLNLRPKEERKDGDLEHKYFLLIFFN